MKILIACNTLTSVAQPIHATMIQFWFRLGRYLPQHNFISFTPRRMSIDNMRNAAARQALEQECDYLMFVDDDVLIDPIKTLQSLLEACEKFNGDIVMAETFIRGYPFEPMFFKHEGEKLIYFREYKKYIDKKTGLVECDAVGFSCVLIKTELLKKVSTPYFLTGTNSTEDVYFCMKARREVGPKVKIYVDTKIPTGHLLDSEPVHVQNREELIKFYDKTVPSLKETRTSYDRGTEYAKKVEQTVETWKTKSKSRVRGK